MALTRFFSSFFKSDKDKATDDSGPNDRRLLGLLLLPGVFETLASFLTRDDLNALRFVNSEFKRLVDDFTRHRFATLKARFNNNAVSTTTNVEMAFKFKFNPRRLYKCVIAAIDEELAYINVNEWDDHEGLLGSDCLVAFDFKANQTRWTKTYEGLADYYGSTASILFDYEHDMAPVAFSKKDGKEIALPQSESADEFLACVFPEVNREAPKSIFVAFITFEDELVVKEYAIDDADQFRLRGEWRKSARWVPRKHIFLDGAAIVFFKQGRFNVKTKCFEKMIPEWPKRRVRWRKFASIPIYARQCEPAVLYQRYAVCFTRPESDTPTVFDLADDNDELGMEFPPTRSSTRMMFPNGRGFLRVDKLSEEADGANVKVGLQITTVRY